MSRRVVLGSRRAPPAADPAFQATEIAHLKSMVTTLEVRLQLLNELYQGELRNQAACQRCAEAKKNEDALWAENEWLWKSREELVERLRGLRDEAFAKAFIERHGAEVKGMKRGAR